VRFTDSQSEKIKADLAKLEAVHKAISAPVQSAASESAPSRVVGGNELWRSARHDERNMRGFNPGHRHGETAVRSAWSTMTARARDMVENDPQVKRPSTMMNRLTIGAGIQLYAMAMKDADDLDEKFNVPADMAWQQWSNDTHFPDIQQSAFKEWSDQGNGIVYSYNKKDGTPACQVIEFEQLDKTLDRPRMGGQNEISNGIEYDVDGEPVFYHVLEAHPQDGFGGLRGSKSQRIPANRIDHLFCQSRPSMRTGVSWWNAMLRYAFDGDFLMGTELTSAAVASLYTAVLKKANYSESDFPDLADSRGPSGSPGNLDGHGNRMFRLGAGNVQVLDPEDSFEVINPQRPNKSLAEFMRTIWLFNSQGANLSYHRSTGDMDGASYTSLRAAMLDDAAFIFPLQEYFGRRFVSRVRRRVDAWHVATRMIPISAARYQKRRIFYRNYLSIGPGQAWLQPDQEIGASAQAIATGQSSLVRECGSKGIYWLQNIRETAMVNRTCERYKVKLDFSKGNGGGQSANSTDARAKPIEKTPKPARGSASAAKANRKRGAA
jgi:lambda family phage portal protein